MSVKQVLVLPSDPHAIKEIRDCLQEISNSMTRAEGEKDFQKDSVESICDKYDLSKAPVNKLAKMHHLSNREAIVNEAQELDEAYDKIFVLKNSLNQQPLQG